MDTVDPSILDPPPFSGRRLFLFATGSINAALLPYWLNWLRQFYPELQVHVSVSASAERFVSVEAIKHLITGSVWRDDWNDPNLPKTAHIDFDSVADCFGVFPATLNTTMRLANGDSSTPTMLALQTTTKPVALAPAFSGTSVLIERQMEQLQMRPNVVFTETVPAFSVGKQAWIGRTGFFMPLLLQALERQLSPKAPKDPTA